MNKIKNQYWTKQIKGQKETWRYVNNSKVQIQIEISSKRKKFVKKLKNFTKKQNLYNSIKF